MQSPSARYSVVDIFCGAGGLSHGFKRQGFHIAGGIDADPDCEFPFSRNNGPFFLRDVKFLEPDFVRHLFAKADQKIMVGCAPCQAFSSYNQKNSRKDWDLLRYFVNIACEVKPDFIAIENVPALQKHSNGEFLRACRARLEQEGYRLKEGVLYGPNFGLPQRRHRYVMIARRHKDPPYPTEMREPRINVLNAIGDLPPLEAGQTSSEDSLHSACNLSELNLERIKASKQGGTWLDWPPHLRARCHSRDSGDGYGAVYGRLSWDRPSPTITTQYYNYGSGRFGHPDQDRGLSLREGAILQGFPRGYKFHPDKQKPPVRAMGRLIGNAVPVPFAEAIACAIRGAIEGERDG